MDADRWDEVRRVFQDVLERRPDERPGLLELLCGQDHALRAEVEALLDGHREAGSFLDQPAVAQAGGDAGDSQDSLAGRTLGSFRVVRRLGRGGMGAVYLAVRADQEFRQRVALKVLRSGMVGRDVIRRFRAERQILAALDHPNIARLLDGGSTADGMPFLVMEYVEGQRIDAYCDSHRLSIRARLELFCTVCSAVQYAHRNLVVHRDLKPSNILITVDGVPKLLDFGIAKILNPELASSSLTPTAANLRLMTPDYTSPEQVRGEPITTAADVYSLGVLLYYLLTGHQPYHVGDRSPAEILRAICQEQPSAPSTVVLTREEVRGPGGGLTRLQRRLSGDLDSIVLMALRKEPERRYASVAQLAEDIVRHLEGHPVLARKDTFPYRWGRFIRRNRLGVTGAAAFVAACLAFGIVTGRQRLEVARERDRAEQVKTFLVELFEAVDPISEEDLTLEDILDKGTRRLSTELTEVPETRAELLETLGGIYQRLAAYDRAAGLLEEALAIRHQVFGREHLEVAQSLNSLGALRLAAGDFAGAQDRLLESLEMRRRLRGEEHAEVAETLNDLGKALQIQGELEAAEDYYRQALDMRRRMLGTRHVEVAETLNNLGGVLSQRGEYTAAEPLHRQALALRESILGRDHVDVSESLNNLAAVLGETGAYAEAQALHERALALRRRHLGDQHPRVATSLHNLAGILRDKGDLRGAEPLYHSAIAIYRDKYDDRHPYVAGSLRALATLHERAGRPSEAEELFRKAAAILHRTVGEDHPMAAWNSTLLAGLLEGRGSFREAASLAEGAAGVLRTRLAENHWKTAVAEGILAAALLGQGRLEDAKPLLFRSAGALRFSPSKPAERWLGFVQRHLGELDEGKSPAAS